MRAEQSQKLIQYFCRQPVYAGSGCASTATSKLPAKAVCPHRLFLRRANTDPQTAITSLLQNSMG